MPIRCDKLVYLELEKTGCTTIGSILVDLFDGRTEGPKHGPLVGDASSYVVGSVRNPWSYYVSLWAFGCQNRGLLHTLLAERHWRAAIGKLPRLTPILREITRDARAWAETYSPPHSPEKFRSWLERIHDPALCKDYDPVYGHSALRQFCGYATYRYCRLYSSDVQRVLRSRSGTELSETLKSTYLPQAMVRTEHLDDDLLEALRGAGYQIDDALEAEVRQGAARRINESSHSHYGDYYDSATTDLVRRRDALVIELHGYEFG